MEKYIVETLRELKRCKVDTLVRRRYRKWRQIGSFYTDGKTVSAKTGAKKSKSPAAKESAAETAPTSTKGAGGNGQGLVKTASAMIGAPEPAAPAAGPTNAPVPQPSGA